MNRQFWIGMLAAAVALGLVLYRQFGSLAAPDRPPQLKAHTIYVMDPHLIRENEEARHLRQKVDAAKKKAFEHGYHACCITPPCSWCLLHLGQCTCAQGVGSGRYACRECHGGWEAQQGRIPGKTKEDVRKMKTIATDFTGEHLEASSQEAGRVESLPPGHEGLTSVDALTISAGEKLYNSINCQSCHQMNGQGGKTGPDLTHEAQRHADLAWQIEHLKDPQKVHPGSTMPSYADQPPDQLKALASYLITRK